MGRLTGTFIDTSGKTITWSSNQIHNQSSTWGGENTDWLGLGGDGSNPTTYALDDGSGGGATGLTVAIGGLTGDDEVQLVVNGAVADLNAMIASGQAILVPTSDFPSEFDSAGTTHGGKVNASGNLVQGQGGTPEDDALVAFNFEVTSVDVVYVGGGNRVSTQLMTYKSTLELTTTATDEAGQSGSFIATNTGDTVDYTITGAGGANSFGIGDIDDSNVWLGRDEVGNTPETLNLSFTSDGDAVAVDGVVVKIGGGNFGEVLTFKVDGVEVDLNTLIASGDITFTPTINAFVNATGGVEFSEDAPTNIETLTFNIPISTLEIMHPGGGNGLLVELYADTTVAETSPPDVAGTPPVSGQPPSVSLSEAIFLGNFTDAETNEASAGVENTAPYLGTFGSPSDPLWKEEVLVTYNDIDGNGWIKTDSVGGASEQISYDLGSGTQTTEVDSLAVVNLTVTYTDGSSQSYTNAVMYQDTDGNMFLTNSDFAGTDLNSGSWPQIQSVDVTSIFRTNYAGLYQNNLQAFVCFTSGTRIATASGDRCIEDLIEGDLVLTMDRGYQPIRWIGSSKREATGDLAPILIRKGTLGNDRDLRVSPQHRMLLQGWQAEMLFGEEEVLASAKSLVNDHSILRDEGGEVEYFHMLFDTHEIIYAEGAPSESFHPGEQGWKALDQATRDEIITLFPELSGGHFKDYGASVRTSLKHNEGQLLGAYLAGLS